MTQPARTPASMPRIDTGLLGALAALLVVNSHLETFYPASYLAGDGLLGNSLFFLLSGFGLQMSQSGPPRTFLSYYRRRILRLYPALWIVVITASLIVGGEWRSWGGWDYVKKLVWPTDFTFFRNIVPFYALFFPILKLRLKNGYLFLILALLIPYFAFYLPDVWRMGSGERLSLGARSGYMHDVAYFQVMLLGGWLGTRPRLPDRPFLALGLFAITFVAYVGCKLVMVRGHFANFYFLLHLFVFLLCGLMYWGFTSAGVVGRVRATRVGDWVVGFVAALTLEIYLVHSYLVHGSLERIRFPFNILALLSFTFVLAWVVKQAAGVVQRWLGERPVVAPPPGVPGSPQQT